MRLLRSDQPRLGMMAERYEHVPQARPIQEATQFDFNHQIQQRRTLLAVAPAPSSKPDYPLPPRPKQSPYENGVTDRIFGRPRTGRLKAFGRG